MGPLIHALKLGGGWVVVASSILVSAQGPLVLGFSVWGLRVGGQGLTNMLVNVIIAFQYLQWTMENVFIFIVFRVFTADTNMERSEEIDPTRRERESWYLEIIDLNMVTITPLSPQLGQWEHISFVFSLSQINNY